MYLPQHAAGHRNNKKKFIEKEDNQNKQILEFYQLSRNDSDEDVNSL